MRRVVCQITKEEGTVSTFFKIRYKDRNLYYKDEKTYLNYLEDKRIRDELNSFVAREILNYDNGQYLPPFYLRKINDLNKLYPMGVVLDTFKANKDDLQYWMNQDSKFSNETGRISYMMAIVGNKVNDEYQKWKVKERNKKKIEKVELDASNINLAVEVSNAERVNKKKGDSISQFL